MGDSPVDIPELPSLNAVLGEQADRVAAAVLTMGASEVVRKATGFDVGRATHDLLVDNNNMILGAAAGAAVGALMGPFGSVVGASVLGAKGNTQDRVDRTNDTPSAPSIPYEFNRPVADASGLHRRRAIFTAMKAIDPLAGDHPKPAVITTPISGMI
jgi:hypothetical protein